MPGPTLPFSPVTGTGIQSGVSLTYPNGVQPGDLALFVASVQNTANPAALVKPTGYAYLADTTSLNGDTTVAISVKALAGTEGGTNVSSGGSLGSGTSIECTLLIVRGCPSSGYLDASAITPATQNTGSIASTSTSNANDLIIQAWSFLGSSSTSSTPSGYTQQSLLSGTGGRQAVYTETQGSPGPISGLSQTTTSTEYCGVVVALLPNPGVTATPALALGPLPAIEVVLAPALGALPFAPVPLAGRPPVSMVPTIGSVVLGVGPMPAVPVLLNPLSNNVLVGPVTTSGPPTFEAGGSGTVAVPPPAGWILDSVQYPPAVVISAPVSPAILLTPNAGSNSATGTAAVAPSEPSTYPGILAVLTTGGASVSPREGLVLLAFVPAVLASGGANVAVTGRGVLPALEPLQASGGGLGLPQPLSAYLVPGGPLGPLTGMAAVSPEAAFLLDALGVVTPSASSAVSPVGQSRLSETLSLIPQGPFPLLTALYLLSSGSGVRAQGGASGIPPPLSAYPGLLPVTPSGSSSTAPSPLGVLVSQVRGATAAQVIINTVHKVWRPRGKQTTWTPQSYLKRLTWRPRPKGTVWTPRTK